MDRLAFIIGDTFIYWSSVVLCLATATAICFFLAFYLSKSDHTMAAFAVIPVSIVLSLALARFFHWYSRSDSYGGFLSAMLDHSTGDYALMGVFLGCFLAALLLKAVRLHKNLPEMLDCMSIGGAAGIAVGRLACFFNAADRGQVIEGVKSLPFVYPVINTVSGVTEYRLATFVIQAMVCTLLFIGLVLFFTGRDSRRRDGDLCLIFLMIYGCSQIVLDSTRYDSLFFRSNGFVSIVQVLGALGLALAIGVFSVRLVKQQGMRWWYVPLWILMAGGIGGAGYMEYYVQRRGNEAAFAYSVMSACLTAVILLVLLVRFLADRKPPKRKKIDRVKKRAK